MNIRPECFIKTGTKIAAVIKAGKINSFGSPSPPPNFHFAPLY